MDEIWEGKIAVFFFLHFKGKSEVRTQLDLIKCMQPKVKVVVNLPKFSLILPHG